MILYCLVAELDTSIKFMKDRPVPDATTALLSKVFSKFALPTEGKIWNSNLKIQFQNIFM